MITIPYWLQIAHRDIKPNNVFVSDAGIKVAVAVLRWLRFHGLLFALVGRLWHDVIPVRLEGGDFNLSKLCSSLSQHVAGVLGEADKVEGSI
jgi:serine/threonine protein kinase